MKPSNKFQNESPETSARVGVITQGHIKERTGFQVTQNRWNVCEAVKETRRRGRSIVKKTHIDQIALWIAEV
jgi:hypothetical protein